MLDACSSVPPNHAEQFSEQVLEDGGIQRIDLKLAAPLNAHKIGEFQHREVVERAGPAYARVFREFSRVALSPRKYLSMRRRVGSAMAL